MARSRGLGDVYKRQGMDRDRFRYDALAKAATRALTFLEYPPITTKYQLLAQKAAKELRAALHGDARVTAILAEREKDSK
jgi:hypothetical protein